MKSGAGEKRISHFACARIVHGGRELRSRGVCSCACRRQRSLGRFFESESSSRRFASKKSRQTRARRQRSSSAFVGSVRQPTGKTKLKMPLSQSSKKTLCVLPEEIIYERKGNHAALTPLEDMSAGRGQAGGGPPQNCEKVFIQRDYSEGTMVKFQTRFPTELESRLDRQLFEYTINQLNNYFAEAERASCSTYCESCLYCLTGYLISICTETHYEKCLRKVAKFISEQNDRVYKPRGLLLTDPTTRGLRLIEISVLDRPAS
ncbi:Golgin subfamily A member 7B [Trachymyrmex zeteki]|uniref:Ras modification protein ERF4 n=2 Tax=Mycetomoellerius zeteki TaxID=64791 RepID=A0A151WMX8_9HYME|nr:Golgin subfamily A member 7B [Trachymyrmex zeteki]